MQENMQKVRYFNVDFGKPIPDFGAGSDGETYVVCAGCDFYGKRQIGSQVTMKGIGHYVRQHLEGCEVREINWLSGRIGTITGFTYIEEYVR